MRHFLTLILLVLGLTCRGQGIKVFHSGGQVDNFPVETVDSISFDAQCPDANGHAYVDLGLPSGALWATCNVGARRPSDFGTFIAPWKSAQVASWGGDWLLPSPVDASELLSQCRWTWDEMDGVKGYRVTGPNGRSIFLPASGALNSSGLASGGLANLYAAYWLARESTQEMDSHVLAFSERSRGIVPRGNQMFVSRLVIGGNPQGEPRIPMITQNGHDYVDLGLSVLWATCNLGVIGENPTSVGNYYMWGAATPYNHDTFDDAAWNAMFQDVNDKYYYRNRFNTIQPEDDAARAAWGDEWRLPTRSEMQELIDKCQWKQMGAGESSYWVVTGPNGRQITLPAAGYIRYSYTVEKVDRGFLCYLTSTFERDVYGAPAIMSNRRIGALDNGRSAYSIRPVKSKHLERLAASEGNELVDLGLSVKWASTNVGAASSAQAGQYVAWGEAATKQQYTKGGYTVAPLPLPAECDVAHAAWGRNWRLPTQTEAEELAAKCRWVLRDGGYEVTGPSGRSIFLPLTGFRSGTALGYQNEGGYYWTSSRDDQENARALRFDLETPGHTAPFFAPAGLAVRPVADAFVPVTGEATGVDWHSATIRCTGISGTSYEKVGVQYARDKSRLTDDAPLLALPCTKHYGEIYADVAFTGNAYSVAMNRLDIHATYYYRAFCVVNGVTYYGETAQFSTTADVPSVDLGLSVKWAVCNVGATGETNYGEYYSWDAGIPQQHWGAAWRLPSYEEWSELRRQCTWTWTTLPAEGEQDAYGGELTEVAGYTVTGPNGQSIFLPAAGYSDFPEGAAQSSIGGGIGDYWSSTPYEDADGYFHNFYFSSTRRVVANAPATYGFSVRPVTE